MRTDLSRGAGGNCLAAVEDMDSLAQIHHKRHVVLDHQNPAIVFRSDVENEIAQFLGFGRSKTRCGFVEKEEVWIDGESTRKTDAAFLAVA